MKNIEGGVPPQEHKEEKKKLSGKGVWDRLAGAFGGYSQVPDKVVGMAIAGHINNGELSNLSVEEATAEINHAVDAICERWEDKDPAPDADKIRQEIIEGMKEEAKEWPEENRVQVLIRALEGKR